MLSVLAARRDMQNCGRYMTATEERTERTRLAGVYTEMADEFQAEGNFSKELLYRAMADRQLSLV
jgi:hypothetical protein